MNPPSGYTIHPSVQRQQSEHGLVYQAIYAIENDQGVQGDPVIVAGTFASAEEAMEAARDAGARVLAQLR